MASGRTGGTQVAVRGDRRSLAVHRQALVAVRGPDTGSRWVVDGPRAVVGSGRGSDVALADDTVSSRHCELSVRDGRYVVRDLESTNGTLVDGVDVVEAFIGYGTRLQLGESELRFEPELEWVLLDQLDLGSFGGLVGNSEAMREIHGVLRRIANTRLTVLFCGQSGTGKEVAARSLHAESNRRAGPFAVLDCGALSVDLVEAQLFGHERGAFTGADRSRLGCFESARGGTLLIDEVGELPLSLQPKLLRVLERREVRRIGGSAFVDVDVRVVAATHRDLEAMVSAGSFREDLYFRLAEVVVPLPPLSERVEDIPLLAAGLVEEEGRRRGNHFTMAAPAWDWLKGRPFAGNVRELRTLLRRAMAMAQGSTIDVFELEKANALGGSGYRPVEQVSDRAIPVGDETTIKGARDQWLRVLEPRYLRGLLQRYGGDLDEAARHAGLHRKSLLRLLNQYGLRDKD
ncbi:MAG: sigma 54-interacting transcriptional regulator [Myxococcota bacterium]